MAVIDELEVLTIMVLIFLDNPRLLGKKAELASSLGAGGGHFEAPGLAEFKTCPAQKDNQGAQRLHPPTSSEQVPPSPQWPGWAQRPTSWPQPGRPARPGWMIFWETEGFGFSFRHPKKTLARVCAKMRRSPASPNNECIRARISLLAHL